MLSIRHSIGKTPLLEHMANDSKSVAHFRCYAIAPPPGVYALSQDGGIPFVSKSWDGNTSDTQIFQQRAQALMSAFKDTPSPRYLVADAKLYCEDNAVHLARCGFITRFQ